MKRIEEIENSRMFKCGDDGLLENFPNADVMWLIARVKRLEFYLNCISGCEPSEYPIKLAREALAEDE